MMASSFHPHAGRVPAAAYYPGDDVIDWVAADGYNWFGCRSHTWRSFRDTFAPFITWASPHRRPLMVAEWGSLEDPHTPGRKAAWIRSAGDTIRSWPTVRAVLYWNSAGRAGRCPFYIDSSRSALDAMRRLAAQPYFAAALPRSRRIGASRPRVAMFRAGLGVPPEYLNEVVRHVLEGVVAEFADCVGVSSDRIV